MPDPTNEPPVDCPECNGDGEAHGMFDVIVGDCGACDGTGLVPDAE